MQVGNYVGKVHERYAVGHLRRGRVVRRKHRGDLFKDLLTAIESLLDVLIMHRRGADRLVLRGQVCLYGPVAGELRVLQHPPTEHHGPYTVVGGGQLLYKVRTRCLGAVVWGDTEANVRRGELLIVGVARRQFTAAEGAGRGRQIVDVSDHHRPSAIVHEMFQKVLSS